MDLNIGFFGAFVAGLLSFASPCVLPLVPPYLSFLAGVSLDQLSAENKTASATRNVVLTAIAFVLGFSTVFVALGASASLIGELLIDHFSTLNYVAGALILLLGSNYSPPKYGAGWVCRRNIWRFVCNTGQLNMYSNEKFDGLFRTLRK